MSTSPAVPAYLLHAPFLTLEHPDTADRPSTPSSLLQRTLPPAPLYYLHPAPPTPPGSAPPVLSISPAPPVKGRGSTVYRATTPSGAKVVVKYGHDLLAAVREAEEVFVNLPGGGGLPIPTFWGIFEGNVEPDQPKSLVMVLEDCGEPIEGGFESLSKNERKKLYDALDAFHSIHFQHGSFSPSSIVAQPLPPSPSASSPDGDKENRKLTIVGYSQAEWHLCPGPHECKELVEARRALGLSKEDVAGLHEAAPASEAD
ncbi:hypothetical protein JCM9279_001884 [Rhodotorula babjevae]